MNRPRICVCVVTYNQRKYIETCLRSILDQVVDADVLVLVGDDASTDGTSTIVQGLVAEYGERLQHLRHESNLGPFANMQKLLLRAQGDYMARVDGDDYWLPGKLAQQIAYLQTYPHCGAVYTNAVTVNESGGRIGVFNDIGDAQLTLADLLRRGNALNNSSVLFRAINTVGWIRADQIDYQVHLWQARSGWLGHLGEPLAAYRVSTQGSLILTDNARVRELYWQAIQSVPRELVSDNDYAHGAADFLRRVCFRAARTHDWHLLSHWAELVFDASPYGHLRTSALVVSSIARISAKLLATWFARLLGSNQPNVLYPY